jgi:hypothetical protein
VNTADHQEEAPERLPPPRLMDWVEYEDGKPGQLPLPGFLEMPTIAERTFIRLMRDWNTTATETKEQRARRENILLTCVFLGAQYGHSFTKVTKSTIRSLGRFYMHANWLDVLAWDLCIYCILDSPVTATVRKNPNGSFDRAPFQELIANSSHHNSATRDWVLDVAYLVRNHIPTNYAYSLQRELLVNIATAIMGVGKSAALLLDMLPSRTEFASFATLNRPPFDPAFSKQYTDRIADFATQAERQPFLVAQSFLDVTEDVSRILSEVALGNVFPPYALRKTHEGDLFPALTWTAVDKTGRMVKD